ncbi:signal transduction histidine kinase [Amycolatopsis bartoniae]|uniref:histidine kinase n=1 Tax=Amycolatopsis bartoniae TaxID=941986 RepID=A0A8H9IUI4_9PSEU|nr:histidine kinase [Amycolatopsis bartoniae]MBB2935844.1 signal transduction histidine kinase [Amycolatopsis bartoniae]TVT04982.1 two-component sensor histidine kinase [Amycolatopsis bartoniae]GHF62256.1 two-component sensor histidine kinase [Amycolatopsis bartoniae]
MRRREVLSLVAAGGLFALLDVALAGRPGPDLPLLLLVDCSLPLLGRFPRAVAALTVAVSVALLGIDQHSLSPVTVPRATPVVIIVLVLRADRRFALAVVAVLAVVAGQWWRPSWLVTPVGLLSTAGPALATLYFDARRQLLRSLRERAERAERERHLLAEQARAEERRRLAAEMHDVVTHRLSLIVLQAGALRLTSGEQSVRAAAEDIRESGAHALRELRDLVGVLRSDGQVTRQDRPVSVPDVATLVAESESVGVPVELITEGDPAGIAPTVARTVFRVVQEALTNVRKHAPGARAKVELRYTATGVEVRVTNTAATAAPDPALTGGGSGLDGLGQRVELVGGTLHSGPTGEGGFAVSAILPAYVTTTESR